MGIASESGGLTRAHDHRITVFKHPQTI